MNTLAELCWPLQRLGEALDELARQAGLPRAQADALVLPESVQLLQPGELSRWIDWAGARMGLEAEEVQANVPDFEQLLRRAGPALVSLRMGEQLCFALVLGRKGQQLRLAAPDGREQLCALRSLRDAACARHERPLMDEVERLLQRAQVPAKLQASARRALLDERLSAQPVRGCWLLRQPATAGYWQQLRLARLPQRVAAMLALVAVMYMLEIAGWSLVGQAALDGRLDMGWMSAWLMLLFTMLPLRSASQWLSASFSLEAGRLLKQRLLAGALRLDLDTVRQMGAGQLMARVIESNALEGQGLSGGIGVVLSVLELGMAAWVLSQGAAPLWHLSLLAAWLLLVCALSWRLGTRLRLWTQQRLAMTHRLVEGMVGHRTRLAQERPQRRDAEEDRAMHGYMQASERLDAAVVPVVAIAPGGWILLGLLGFAPALLNGPVSASALAISLGGVLFAHRALGGLSGSFSLLARARIAWDHVAPLFKAGAVKPATAPFLPAEAALGSGTLLDASGVGFRYRPQGDAVLRDVNLRIGRGERVLLQGSSGGGKSTLAALMVGLREPGAGLLLLNGLDRATLGDQWHRLATEAPQYHDNHIMAGTLSFNLLMGRGWPASEADVQEAQTLCEELGLGELLARMPAGLQQRVGETGWQLSHGEKSRIFLARALLQRTPLTVLDESFAALDPPTLRRCLECALRRTDALVVIAHP